MLGLYFLQIENDIKDLHPEILFPEKDRYTLKYSPYKI